MLDGEPPEDGADSREEIDDPSRARNAMQVEMLWAEKELWKPEEVKVPDRVSEATGDQQP